MSYFFVDEIPEDDLANPTDDYSILESKVSTPFNPMNSPNRVTRKDQQNSFSQSRSYIYKQSEPNIFSDMAMQLKHKGLTVRQAILCQLELDTVQKLRKNSSKVQLRTQKKEVESRGQFLKVLVLLEKGKGLSIG